VRRALDGGVDLDRALPEQEQPAPDQDQIAPRDDVLADREAAR